MYAIRSYYVWHRARLVQVGTRLRHAKSVTSPRQAVADPTSFRPLNTEPYETNLLLKKNTDDKHDFF